MNPIEKNASVHWEGQGRQGHGSISTQTAALNAWPYGFGSRFEDERRGTNPEELLAAAHAACFTMAFSFACDKAGFATTAVQAVVPGIDETRFAMIANTAKSDCPLSKALGSVSEITLEARLLQG
jgi:osmotically inducible protein OsmC